MGKPARKRALSDYAGPRRRPHHPHEPAQAQPGCAVRSAASPRKRRSQRLTFSPKRVAREVKKVLQSAIANAENNHDLDVDDLVVSEASVGRNLVMKRFHARARGRGARIEKPFAQLTIVVEEKREEKKARTAKAASGRRAEPRRKPSGRSRKRKP